MLKNAYNLPVLRFEMGKIVNKMANPEYEWKRNDWYGMKNVCLNES